LSLPELLYQNASVYKLLSIADDYGTYVNTSTEILPNVICRKNLKNVTKRLANGKIKQIPNTYKVFLNELLTISEKDLLYLDGVYYDILHIYPVFDSNLYNHTEIIVKLIENFDNSCYLLTEDLQGVLAESGEFILLENC
jgi:hypothetical protein